MRVGDGEGPPEGVRLGEPVPWTRAAPCHGEGLQCWGFSRATDTLWALFTGARVRAWDTSTGALRWDGTVAPDALKRSEARHLCPLDEDRTLLAVTLRSLVTWDLATGQTTATLTLEGMVRDALLAPGGGVGLVSLTRLSGPPGSVRLACVGLAPPALRWTEDDLEALALSPDGALAVCAPDRRGPAAPRGPAVLLRTSTRERLPWPEGWPTEPVHAAFLDDSEGLALLTGSALTCVERPTGRVRWSVPVAPSGRVYAAPTTLLRAEDARLVSHDLADGAVRGAVSARGALPSPDGATLVRVPWEGNLLLVRRADRRAVGDTTPRHHAVVALGADPAGRRAWSLDRVGTALLWEVSTGRSTLRVYHQPGTLAALSPDGALLALATREGGVEAWPTDGAAVSWREGASRGAYDFDPFDDLGWSPDGALLVATRKGRRWCWSADGTLRWETRAQQLSHGSRVRFTPDGRTLLVLGGPRHASLQRVDPSNGAVTGTALGPGRPVIAVVTPDGEQVLDRADDGALERCALGSGEVLLRYQLPPELPGDKVVRGVALHPEGALVAAAVGRSVVLWTLAEGTLRGTLDVSTPVDEASAVCFLPEGGGLLVGTTGGAVARVPWGAPR
ncbi:MAG: WD40 repeat domain-containing protein [Deltaproteobacteria bacterium]|nr:WD40 repeat domain-containing protein [Deltaproteobacteria bacterium]